MALAARVRYCSAKIILQPAGSAARRRCGKSIPAFFTTPRTNPCASRGYYIAALSGNNV
jgi:hypothetical protein